MPLPGVDRGVPTCTGVGCGLHVAGSARIARSWPEQTTTDLVGDRRDRSDVAHGSVGLDLTETDAA